MSSDLPAILGTRAAASSPPPPHPRAGRHRWFALAVISLVVLFAALTWRRWIPPTMVQVVRVEALAGDGKATTGNTQIAFQAAGWIEADPFLTEISALIDGTVTEVPVLAGQAVAEGTIIARLNDDDQRLRVTLAEATLARAEAAQRLADARVIEAEAELARLPARLAAATAERDERRDRAKRLEASGSAVALGERDRALLLATAAEHQLTDLQGSDAVLRAGVAATRAEVAERAAAVAEARTALAQATLALERTVIRAPHAGVIQRLLVRPGVKLMVSGDLHGAATAAELYDPAHLQVRVDVALADVGRLTVGQRARITCEALGDRVLDGTVTRIDGMADVARNTLQAKVALATSDPLLRPEMLCRVQFLGGTTATGTTGRVRLLLPASAVGESGNTQREVWTIDADDRARRVRVRLGDRSGDQIEVLDGLTAGGWVIRDPPNGLSVGERVRAQEAP